MKYIDIPCIVCNSNGTIRKTREAEEDDKHSIVEIPYYMKCKKCGGTGMYRAYIMDDEQQGE